MQFFGFGLLISKFAFFEFLLVSFHFDWICFGTGFVFGFANDLLTFCLVSAFFIFSWILCFLGEFCPDFSIFFCAFFGFLVYFFLFVWGLGLGFWAWGLWLGVEISRILVHAMFLLGLPGWLGLVCLVGELNKPRAEHPDLALQTKPENAKTGIMLQAAHQNLQKFLQVSWASSFFANQMGAKSHALPLMFFNNKK